MADSPQLPTVFTEAMAAALVYEKCFRQCQEQEPRTNALKVNTSESAGCLSAPACILERVCTTAKASEVVQPKHQYLHTSQPLATVVK
ncbi:hypothetical protein PAL_GLEAN10017182 [Pteropus alecto]|uniref:Uncharacterized protein n=1 Tax=Pteropus alecto TaxID=9402 RepID=L5KHS5_PTEAL|nr:hypothetical protein PAL_GLEAN10017182 [Pteropus alecto]